MAISMDELEPLGEPAEACSANRVEAPGPSEAECARLRRPCVRVWNESVWVDRGQGLARDPREQKLPAIELSFAYEAFRVRAAEPGARVFCAQRGTITAFERDLPAEARARLVLESFGAIEIELLEDHATAPDCSADYLISPEAGEQAHCAFTAHALPQLRALGWQVEIAEDFPYQVKSECAWYVAVEPAEGKPDWFGLELGVEIGGHRIDLLPVLLAMLEDAGKRFELTRLERHGPRFVPISGHTGYVEVPAEHFRTLARVLAELYQGEAASVCFPAVRASALFTLEQALLRDRGARGLEGPAAAVLELRARAMRGIETRAAAESPAEDLPAPPPPPGLHAELRPYQVAGVQWLARLARARAGGVLADDMGLGKTLQTIAHLCAERESGRAQAPSLIVAPTSLIGNWRRELARFAPALRVSVLFGANRAAARATLPACDVALTSYAVLLRDADFLCGQAFHGLVLDEAQAIKNPRSRAAQLCKALAAEHRICLSGTPVENHLHELWSLFDFALPGLLGSEEQFRHFYRAPIEQQGDEQRLVALRELCAPYLIRRTKEQVARELPKKTEIVLPIELRGRQRELYESIRIAAHDKVRAALRQRGFAGSTVTILAALTRLRQLCCDPRLVPGQEARGVHESAKYTRLLELVREQQRARRPLLVFSQFASMLGLISRGLREQGIPHACLTGATADRDRPVRAFQNGEVGVFLISLKAGGTGLNLTRAETVIHYDPWWNPAAQAQATDRAHRIGQDKPVFVYSLIAAGSVEERMLGLQLRKRRLAEAVVASPAAQTQAHAFAQAEVEHLLAPLEPRS